MAPCTSCSFDTISSAVPSEPELDSRFRRERRMIDPWEVLRDEPPATQKKKKKSCPLYFLRVSNSNSRASHLQIHSFVFRGKHDEDHALELYGTRHGRTNERHEPRRRDANKYNTCLFRFLRVQKLPDLPERNMCRTFDGVAVDPRRDRGECLEKLESDAPQ